MSFSFVDILFITTPVTFVVLIGYLAVKVGMFPKEGGSVLVTFLLNFALPAALFFAISSHDLNEIFDVNLFSVFVGAMLLNFFANFAYTRWRGATITQSTFDGLGSSGCNFLMISLPILLLIFPKDAYTPVILGSLAQDLIIIPMTLILVNLENKKGSARDVALLIAKKFATTPMIIAIFLGVVVSGFQIEMPVIVDRTTEILGATLAGTGLFSIGVIMANVKIEGAIERATRMTVMKLLSLPLLAFAFLLVIPDVSPAIKTATVIAIGAPMFGLYTALAHQHGVGRSAGLASLIATALSFVSLTLIIWALFAYQPFGPLN